MFSRVFLKGYIKKKRDHKKEAEIQTSERRIGYCP